MQESLARYIDNGDKPGAILLLTDICGALYIEYFLTDPNRPRDLSTFVKCEVKELTREGGLLHFKVEKPGTNGETTSVSLRLDGPLNGKTFPAAILDGSGKVTLNVTFERIEGF
jgi:hypothetical protein